MSHHSQYLCQTNSTYSSSAYSATGIEKHADESGSLLEEEMEEGLTWQGASIIMLKFIVCSGFLFLPHAMSNAGWMLGLALFLLAWLLNLMSMLRLKDARDLLQGEGTAIGSTYENLARLTLGMEFKKLVSFLVVTSQLMFICNAFHLITTVSRQTFFEELRLGDQAFSEIVLNACVVSVLASLALVRRIQSFEQFFQAGSAAVGCTALQLISMSSQKLSSDGMASGVYTVVPQSALIFFSEAMFAIEGLPCILPVYDLIKLEHKKYFNRTVILCMVMVIFLYSATSLLCYLSIGDRLKPNILNVMDNDSIYSREMIKGIQLFSIVVSVPIELQPAFLSLEKQFFKRQPRSFQRHWKKNSMRIGLVIMCCIIAHVFESQQDKLIGLLSALFVVPLAIIIPWLLHQAALKKVQNERGTSEGDNKEEQKDMVAIAVGCMCGLATFFTSCYFLSNRT